MYTLKTLLCTNCRWTFNEPSIGKMGGPSFSFLTLVMRSSFVSLCLYPRVPSNELRDVLGNVVRQCASSLLGSYIHQELI